MANISPGITHLARHVLSLESARSGASVAEIEQAALACEKLRVSLTKLAGSSGFSTLLARAVAMAIKKDPSLTPLRVEINGSLTGIDEVRRGLNGSHYGHHGEEHHGEEHHGGEHHGGATVLAELLGLLVSFVGESLTLTPVREAWPNASMDPTENSSTREMP